MEHLFKRFSCATELSAAAKRKRGGRVTDTIEIMTYSAYRSPLTGGVPEFLLVGDPDATASDTGKIRTAVSLPNDLFRKAEAEARRLGVSRSKLYATAIPEFLDRQRANTVVLPCYKSMFIGMWGSQEWLATHAQAAPEFYDTVELGGIDFAGPSENRTAADWIGILFD